VLSPPIQNLNRQNNYTENQVERLLALVIARRLDLTGSSQGLDGIQDRIVVVPAVHAGGDFYAKFRDLGMICWINVSAALDVYMSLLQTTKFQQLKFADFYINLWIFINM
jgi:hypothetical protein